MLDRNKLPELTAKRLIDLLELPEQNLADGDVAFLWARQGYLTKEEKDRYSNKFKEYKKAIEEKMKAENYDGDDEKTEGDPNPKPLVEFIRADLDKMARDIYGIEKPEELANKTEVIKAIETAKASKAE